MKVKSFFALLGVVAIPVTIALVSGWNPLPWVLEHASSGRVGADPPPAWNARLDAAPDWVATAGGAVVVGGDGYLTSLSATSGDRLWSGPVSWAGVAGTGPTAVVVAGGRESDRHLMDVLDPRSGAVLWQWPHTVAAWTFTDMVLTLTCEDSELCTLAAHAPRSRPGESLWSVALPGGTRGLSGLNHALAGPGSALADRLAAAPPVLGFPVDDKVWLVDTTGHRQPQSMSSNPDSRLLTAGDGTLRIEASLVNDGCRYTLAWTRTGRSSSSWHTVLYQPRTSDGSVCEQRGTPSADGGLLYATGPGREDVLLDLATGKPRYAAGENEKILAVGGPDLDKPSIVLLRGADGKAVIARSVDTGTELWRQAVNRDTAVRTDGSVVAFVDAGTGSLTARWLAGGSLAIRATTLATLLGFTPDGLMLNEVRTVGLLRYGAVHP